jgi:glycosyltransferase involved in cell wall biosynthesis
MNPWVSILTPLYNGVEFLEQCAMSVCLQNLKNEFTELTVEWWIGVNGHGDGGAVLLRAQQVANKCRNFCTVRVVNLATKGKVATLNTLAAKANGEWIAVLDCDDTWERNKLIYQKLAIDQSKRKIDVCGTYCRYFGDLVSNGPSLPKGYISSKEMWEANPIINSSALIRRELALWEDRFGLEDYDLWLRLADSGAVFFNVPEYLVNHRIHAGSAFNGKGKQDVPGLLSYHLFKATGALKKQHAADSSIGVLPDKK